MRDRGHKATRPGRDLPLWFRMFVIGIILGCLVFNIFADVYGPPDYNGAAVSISLIGFLGGTVAELVLRLQGKNEE